jgi:DNA topoisomerase-1
VGVGEKAAGGAGRRPEPLTPRAMIALERSGRAKWWRRRGSKGRGFWYADATGARLADGAQIERIKALVIPPAWREVRINPAAGGRLQAVGIDTTGRVQYLYHPKFAERRQRQKYAKLERFGELLPRLREAANRDIQLEGWPKEKVLAIVVRLINDMYFRLGSEESVERYKTYGVTTLRNRHMSVTQDGEVEIRFVGKHHIKQRKLLVDRELAALLCEVKQIRGARLFNYLDNEGKPHPITPRDVNEYIKAATAAEFSAKDFRTWGGTLLAAVELAEAGPAPDVKKQKKVLTTVTKRVAEQLGNTATVCRESYIHPVVFERYCQGITLSEFRKRAERAIRRRSQPEYEVEELALLELFRSRDDPAQPADSKVKPAA